MKESKLGVASFILGILGMITSCIGIGIVFCLIGLVFSITGFLNKEKSHATCLGGLLSSIIGIIIFAIVLIVGLKSGIKTYEQETFSSSIQNRTEEVTIDVKQTEAPSIKEVIKATTEPIAEQTTTKEISEQDYKNSCVELYYDDIFFGKDDLFGEKVKVSLFLSEKYYFTTKNMSSESFKEYNRKYNLNKDFFKCCVLRKDTNSYVGQQINLWFSDNFDIKSSDYNAGQKIIVYGEVVSWSNNTWKGYNSVTIIPQYIEMEE